MEEFPIRVTKIHQGRRYSLEVAFVTLPNGLGAEMLARISAATGLSFRRPVGNLQARKELHIAAVDADEATFDAMFLQAELIAKEYGVVSETRQNLGAPEPGDEPMPIDRRGLKRRKPTSPSPLGGAKTPLPWGGAGGGSEPHSLLKSRAYLNPQVAQRGDGYSIEAIAQRRGGAVGEGLTSSGEADVQIAGRVQMRQPPASRFHRDAAEASSGIVAVRHHP